MRRLLVLFVLLVGLSWPAPANADDGGCWASAGRCRALVAARADHGVAGLDQDGDLQRQAQAWAEHMAATGVLSHSVIGFGAEIVGFGPDTPTIITAFLGSPEHRQILLDPAYRRVGVGHAWSGGTLWLSVRFDY